MRAIGALALAACGRLSFDPIERQPDAPSCATLLNDDDGDGIDDLCDVCPFVGSGTGDADLDGVGDACDPSSAREQIATFDPFTGTTFDPRWQVVDSTVANSQATLGGIGRLGRLGYLTDPTQSTASVRGEIDTLGNSNDRQISIQHGDATNDEADYCEVFGQANPRLKMSGLINSTFATFGEVEIELTTGPFALEIHAEPGRLRCRLVLGSGPPIVIDRQVTFARTWQRIYVQLIDVGARLDNFAEVVTVQ